MEKVFKSLIKNSWSWQIESEDMLEPWFDNFSAFEANALKSNPVRRVFKVHDNDGNEYFVKHDTPKGLIGNFKAFFRTKAENESDIYRILRSLDVPCVDCVGWGKCFPEGMLLTKALENSMNAMEYWFRYAVSDFEKKAFFIKELTGLLRRFRETRLVHNDFHAGNILYSSDTGKIYIVDPCGVRRSTKAFGYSDAIALMKIFMTFRGEMEQKEIIECCINAKIESDCTKAEKLWSDAVADEEEKIRRDWSRRAGQLLGGTSKFAVETRKNGNRLFLRNTLWYTPAEIDMTKLTSKVIPHNQAERIWLESFLSQLLRKKSTETPVAWEISTDEKSDILYF